MGAVSRVNTSFSLVLPTLQFAVDSTSLGTFKECPRKYYYSIVLGWQPRSESVHLTFGLHYHAALERYDHARVLGATHDEAARKAIRYAMEATWVKALGRPWFSDHPSKNRLTLVRSVCWYLDHFEHDPLQTIVLSSGKPAVELSFSYHSGHFASTGEEFILCGHIDKIAEMAKTQYACDKKTTTGPLSGRFFEQFSPGNQFSMYLSACRVVWDLPISDLIVDAAQVGAGFTRFMRAPVHRDGETLDEWMRDTRSYLSSMDLMANEGYWPQNDKSCGNFGGCTFQGICSRPPRQRDEWLRQDFTKRVWDPLQRRGDI